VERYILLYIKDTDHAATCIISLHCGLRCSTIFLLTFDFAKDLRCRLHRWDVVQGQLLYSLVGERPSCRSVDHFADLHFSETRNALGFTDQSESYFSQLLCRWRI